MKCLDNFANIGKAAIIQSLGFQKNYTEVIKKFNWTTIGEAYLELYRTIKENRSK